MAISQVFTFPDRVRNLELDSKYIIGIKNKPRIANASAIFMVIKPDPI